MRRWCVALMVLGAVQLLGGLAFVPVGWWAIVQDHYVARNRLGLAFRDGAINAEAYPQFASANGIYNGGESDIGREAPGSGNRSAGQLLIWVNAGSQKLPPLVIVFPWLLAGCGLMTLLIGWRIRRAESRMGAAS